MNITALAQGTELTVSTLIDNMPVNIKTKAISVMEDSLLVGPLKYHGQPIPAATQATAISKMPSGISINFHLESVIPYENWNDTYYLLKGTEAISDADNQRKAERYVINALSKAVINHVTTTSAIIYDISIRGLSLLLGKSATAKAGDTIRLTFKPAGYTKAFEMNLTVVRNFKIGTYDAVGCKMRGIDSQLMTYILSVKKQKDEIKRAQSLSMVTVHDESAQDEANAVVQ
ncbi:PilZ domain-containing protein [Butyrivibrio sp. INlla16]|uniref:PilZ domain-containing protein n=1 Tax=Butyrivibrio sp. INlla16 TaxID=1520807 RepID=UPI00088C0F2C|nr:PilZ domain-containing protein [Butyrivibrio sp. INlla16]SDB02289.1 PilZ domain-containing protein [Butyrivibrio sp. INlla16]